MRPIYLSYLTAPVDDPFEALRIAADAGYAGLGLRLCDPATGMAASPLVGNPTLCRRFAASLKEAGLSAPEIEARVLMCGPDPQIAPEVVEAAAMLGRPCVIAVADQRGDLAHRRTRPFRRPLHRGRGIRAGGRVRAHRPSRRRVAGSRTGDCFGLRAGRKTGSGRAAPAPHGDRRRSAGSGGPRADAGLSPLRRPADPGRSGRPYRSFRSQSPAPRRGRPAFVGIRARLTPGHAGRTGNSHDAHAEDRPPAQRARMAIAATLALLGKEGSR